MNGNFKTSEKPFTQADVERLARRALQRAHGDPDKAGRYAASIAELAAHDQATCRVLFDAFAAALTRASGGVPS